MQVRGRAPVSPQGNVLPQMFIQQSPEEAAPLGGCASERQGEAGNAVIHDSVV